MLIPGFRLQSSHRLRCEGAHHSNISDLNSFLAFHIRLFWTPQSRLLVTSSRAPSSLGN